MPKGLGIQGHHGARAGRGRVGDAMKSCNGINTTSNLEELLRTVHQPLRTATDAENCFVALDDDKTGLFHSRSSTTDTTLLLHPPARRSCTADVFCTGKRRQTQDSSTDGGSKERSNSWGLPDLWLGVPLQFPE